MTIIILIRIIIICTLQDDEAYARRQMRRARLRDAKQASVQRSRGTQGNPQQTTRGIHNTQGTSRGTLSDITCPIGRALPPRFAQQYHFDHHH